MNSLTSLERTVVWRFDDPSSADLASFRSRVRADLATSKKPEAVRPFLVVTPVGLRAADELLRAFAIRGIVLAERRVIEPWPRCASAMSARTLDDVETLRSFTHEEIWRALFPRGDAEQWVLDGDVSLERARAWRTALREIVRSVRVTVQGVRDSVEIELPALHVPESADLEREWRALWSWR